MGEGGTPSQVQMGRGVTSPQVQMGQLPHPADRVGTPSKIRTGDTPPPQSRTGWGTPPPPPPIRRQVNIASTCYLDFLVLIFFKNLPIFQKKIIICMVCLFGHNIINLLEIQLSWCRVIGVKIRLHCV